MDRTDSRIQLLFLNQMQNCCSHAALTALDNMGDGQWTPGCTDFADVIRLRK